MRAPQPTILITNHNYEKYIADAIQSAINQKYPIRPVVCVVDDGSTDDSRTVIISSLFGDNIPNYVKQENGLEVYKYENHMAIFLPACQGPSLGRNVGIELTKDVTDFYMILDADDIMHESKTQRFAEVLFLADSIGVVYADYDILNVHTGNVIREYKEPYSRERLLQECIVHSGAGIKKSVLLDVADDYGYYDINMRTAEDYELWIRISKKYMIQHIAEPLTLVRVHNQNSSTTVSKEIWQRNWSYIGQKHAKN